MPGTTTARPSERTAPCVWGGGEYGLHKCNKQSKEGHKSWIIPANPHYLQVLVI